MAEPRQVETFNDLAGDGYQRAIDVLDGLHTQLFEFEGALPEGMEMRRADQLENLCRIFLGELEKVAHAMGLTCWPQKT